MGLAFSSCNTAGAAPDGSTEVAGSAAAGGAADGTVGLAFSSSNTAAAASDGGTEDSFSEAAHVADAEGDNVTYRFVSDYTVDVLGT